MILDYLSEPEEDFCPNCDGNGCDKCNGRGTETAYLAEADLYWEGLREDEY
jgi:hypothetical protein